jgi:wobble nucleotide-excising tRNase
MFDKQPKTLRFFNMFGELIDNMEDIKDMSQV